MKVEFLAKEGQPRKKGARETKVFGARPGNCASLRFSLKKPSSSGCRGVRVKLPAPAAFLIHKLVHIDSPRAN